MCLQLDLQLIMRVLVACEFSGVVREAFRSRGHDASKATCLWLQGLEPLRPTEVLPGGRKARRANQTPSGQNKVPPTGPRNGIQRWQIRSVTYSGIAKAMAEQWE